MIIFILIEPLKLIGEGEYNINALKEIATTTSYLGLDKDIKKCQSIESFDSCTTRHYINSLLKQCGCLPLNLRLSDKVLLIKHNQTPIKLKFKEQKFKFMHLLIEIIVYFTWDEMCEQYRISIFPLK